MKILFTSDIHVDSRHLDTACDIAATQSVDGLIIGGDLIPHFLPRRSPRDLLAAHTDYLKTVFVPRLKNLHQSAAIRIYLDLGNDDLLGARKVLAAHDGELFHLLHLRRHKLTDAIDIIGYMNVPPTPFLRKDWEKPDTGKIPYEPGNRIRVDGYISRNGRIEETVINLDNDDTIEKELAFLSKDIHGPFVFVSHSPPYDTPLDVLDNGTHVGSRAIRRFIQKWGDQGVLIVSLHGHIHESPFRSGAIHTRIGKSLCLNPGQRQGPASEFRYVIFEIETRLPRPTVRILQHPPEKTVSSGPLLFS